MCAPFPTEWSRPVDGAVSEPLSESPLIAGRAWVRVSRSELAHRGSRPCCQPRLRRRTLFTVGFLMHRTHPAITWHNGQAASLCSHHPRARPLSRAASSNLSELSRACSRDATRRYAAGGKSGKSGEGARGPGRHGPRSARCLKLGIPALVERSGPRALAAWRQEGLQGPCLPRRGATGHFFERERVLAPASGSEPQRGSVLAPEREKE